MRRLYPIINSAVNEIMQLSQNRQHMQNVAISDNQQILFFLMRRDEAGGPPCHEYSYASSVAYPAKLNLSEQQKGPDRAVGSLLRV